MGKVIKVSLRNALLIFLMSIYNRADAMLLERIEGKPAAAVWASGFRLLDIANISGLMFAGLLLPLFGNLLAQKQPVAPVVKLSVNVLLPVSIVITIAGVYYSLPIMQWLYKGASGINEGKIYANVFAVLMLSFPAWCIMYVYSTLLTAAGSLTTLNRIAFVGVLFNITMNIVLIISYHIIGAAITSTATQWLMALLFTYFTKREFAMPYNAVWLAKMGLFVAVLLLLMAGMARWLIVPIWQINMAIYVAVGILCIFMLKLVSWGDVKKLFDKGNTMPAD